MLAHYGVRGMHWGVHRKRGSSDNASTDAKNAHATGQIIKKHGTSALSNKELQDYVTRMNLEQQYSKLASPSRGKKVGKGVGKFVSDILLNVGKQQATKLASEAATKQVASMLAKAQAAK